MDSTGCLSHSSVTSKAGETHQDVAYRRLGCWEQMGQMGKHRETFDQGKVGLPNCCVLSCLTFKMEVGLQPLRMEVHSCDHRKRWLARKICGMSHHQTWDSNGVLVEISPYHSGVMENVLPIIKHNVLENPCA